MESAAVCASKLFAAALVLPISLSAQPALQIQVGAAARIIVDNPTSGQVHWQSSAPQIAQVFQNGFVVGLKPGQAEISAEPSRYAVTVQPIRQSVIVPATLKQYPDSREFVAGGRKCFGSELNGERASDPDEKKFTRSNRVINPTPLRPDKPLDWELRPGTEVFDGAGILIGTVPATLKVAGKMMPVSMFNFGASKILHDRICVYAFSVTIENPATRAKAGTSAWLPLADVVDDEGLIERIGLGRARPLVLPLEAAGFRITGGDPKKYLTPYGELSIVRQISIGALPSHYLRRPSGTINLVYSVPGFGLGGQGVDSFLISDGLEFYPAKGAKVFRQPTYYPSKSPQAGKVSPETMTFLYGAIKVAGSQPVYGWIAKEALAIPE